MDLRTAYRSEIGPSDRIEEVCVQEFLVLEDHGGVEIKDFEEKNHIWRENCGSVFVNCEFFIPPSQVFSLYSQIAY